MFGVQNLQQILCFILHTSAGESWTCHLIFISKEVARETMTWNTEHTNGVSQSPRRHDRTNRKDVRNLKTLPSMQIWQIYFIFHDLHDLGDLGDLRDRSPGVGSKPLAQSFHSARFWFVQCHPQRWFGASLLHRLIVLLPIKA